jgi:hypothetical protein
MIAGSSIRLPVVSPRLILAEPGGIVDGAMPFARRHPAGAALRGRAAPRIGYMPAGVARS